MPNNETTVVSPLHVAIPATASAIKKDKHLQEEKPAGLFSTLPYYSLLLLQAFVYVSIAKWRQPWLGAFIVFAFLPLADAIFPEDWLNPTEKQIKQLVDDVYFKIPLYLAVITDWIYYFWLLDYLTQQSFDLLYLSGVLFLSASFLASNFMVAHELFHKHDLLSRTVGCLTMTKMLYTHLFIEHQYGHHKNVATPLDPASARYQETIYHFVPRSILGSFISAWKIEKRRLLEVEECSTYWHPYNRMIWFVLGYPAFAGIIYTKYGFCGLAIALYLAFQAIVFVEAINYIEHYGLERKEIAPGEYEKIDISHSWNAPHRITNYILFKLQRHSDHHENGYKPYQTLVIHEDSPMLPSGYAFCITLSFVPKYWFNTINPLLMRYKKREKITAEEKANAKKWMNAFMELVTIVFGILMLLGLVTN